MRRKFLLACATLGTVLGAIGMSPAEASRWLTYQNDRYGTTIDYPNQFEAEPPPGAADGRMTEGFSMTYPAAAKQTYDPIVARMTKSFRSGKGFQSP
jgi:hypothetical protein